MLTRSPEIGVDLFIKPGPALALFFQGHPEYAAETLLREYLRDVGRFLRGEREAASGPAVGLLRRRHAASAGRPCGARRRRSRPERIADYVRATEGAALSAVWRPWAVGIYRAWLEQIAERKAGRVATSGARAP